MGIAVYRVAIWHGDFVKPGPSVSDEQVEIDHFPTGWSLLEPSPHAPPTIEGTDLPASRDHVWLAPVDAGVSGHPGGFWIRNSALPVA